MTYTGDGLVGQIAENSATARVKTYNSAADWADVTLAASDQLYITCTYRTSDGYTMPTGLDATTAALNE